MVRIPDAALLVIALAWSTIDASTARAYEACARRCASNDLACSTAAALCEVKLGAYEAWTRQIDAGEPKHALPAIYREILAPHYPHVDLAQIRFAWSDRQPPDNATTDCRFVYFNDAPYVAALRDAGPNRKWKWLLHELVHAEQCARGGRDRYALRWWNELETAVRESGETIDLFQTTEELVRQLQALYVRVHGAMPMEKEADARAAAVLAELRRCCVAPDGSPVRPPAPP